MNLKDLFFGAISSATHPPAEVREDDPSAADPTPTTAEPVTAASGTDDEQPALQAEAKTPLPGLTDSPDLAEFFKRNHFGLGRHNGSRFPSEAAKAMGIGSIVSTFQKVTTDIILRKKAHIDRLEHLRRQVGHESSAGIQLSARCEQLRAHIHELESELARSGERVGWVRSAIDLYELGFQQGQKEAIEFELGFN